MRYAVTYHQPTAVVDCVRGEFIAPDAYSLAVAKVNKVELYLLTPEGLRYDCGLEIWGTITNLCEVKREDKTSLLLVTTDHPEAHLLLLSHSSSPTPSLIVVSSVSLKARAGRIAEFCQCSIVHGNGRVAVTSAYTGSLKVCLIGDDGKIKESDIRIREQNLLSFAFLPLPASSLSPPTLALLHIDHNGMRHLLTRSLLHVPAAGSTKSSQAIDISDPTAHITDIVLDDEWDADTILPVPAYGAGAKPGVLVLGEGRATWYGIRDAQPDPKGKRRSSSSASSPVNEKGKGKGKMGMGWLDECRAKLPYGKMVAASMVGDDGSRVLLGDAYGKLYLLALCRNQADGPVSSIQLHSLGETSPASRITHLSSSYFYIGSKQGDSQVIRLLPAARSNSYIEVIDTHVNLAPICDFIVSDPENIGQSQIVTCSGRMGAGSLRVIRSGVAFDELGLADQVMNTRAIFPVRFSFDAKEDLYLVVSSLSHTALYALSGTESAPHFEQVDAGQASGLVRTAPTLACANVKEGNLVVQVTAQAVVAIDVITWEEQYRWMGDEIVCADINGEVIAVGLKGGKLVCIMPTDKQFIVKWPRELPPSDIPNEIACVALDPTLSESLNTYVAVAYWGSNTIEILDHANQLRAITIDPPLPPEPHLPTSLHLTTFGGQTSKPHLLVGLGNGTLSSYVLGVQWVEGNAVVKAGERKSFALGTKPIMLSACVDSKNGASVFACGDRPALVFLKNDRLQSSYIKLRDVHAGSKLHSAQCPDAFIFASATSLLIGRISELQKLDVRSIPLGLDTPVRISYHKGLRAYGVACQRQELNRENGAETMSSTFKLFDDVTFEHINNFAGRPDEQIMCASTMPDTTKQYDTEYFIVGTYEATEDEVDPRKGRILVFEEAANRKLRLIGKADAFGAVYSVTHVGSFLAAAINGSVRIYSMEPDIQTSELKLDPVFTWSSAYVATSLVSRGNTLFVGDAMRSVCVLQWTGRQLQVVAHDYTSLWLQTVESIDEDSIIGAEINNNITTWRVEGKKLERDGTWYFGEGINRFRNASVAASASVNGAHPSLIFCTNTGRIGVVASLDDQLSLDLSNLQRNMGYVIQGPGNIDHAKHRAPQATPGLPSVLVQASHSTGFIDGDFVERFLDFDQAGPEITQILEGKSKQGHERLEKSYQELTKVIEELQRLH